MASVREPEPGDLIEIFRGRYSHWAVYVGDGYVVHFVADGVFGLSASSTANFPSHSKNGEVKRDPLSKVVGGGKYCVNNKHDRKYGHKPREEIVRDAEAMVGERLPYHLIGKNCEHFATKLRYGVAVSEQVAEAGRQLFTASSSVFRFALSTGIVGGALGAAAIATDAFGAAVATGALGAAAMATGTFGAAAVALGAMSGGALVVGTLAVAVLASATRRAAV